MQNNDINVVREWDFEVNLSGLQAPTGGGKNLPEGFYKCLVSDMYVNPEKNNNRVVIKVTIAEGPFKGTVRTSGLNKPTGPDDNVRYYWRGLAESVGYDPAVLDKGQIGLRRTLLGARSTSTRRSTSCRPLLGLIRRPTSLPTPLPLLQPQRATTTPTLRLLRSRLRLRPTLWVGLHRSLPF
jgi:hypothetical protein